MAPDASPPPARWPRFWLPLAFLGAAVLELAVAARSPIIAKDGIRFIHIAQRLESQPRAAIQQEDQHPGYPALIWAAHWAISGNLGLDSQAAWELAARLPPMLAGVACVGLVWLLGRCMFDARIATVAALLMVPLPLFRRNAADTLSDTPHLACYLAAVWLACQGFASNGPAWRRAVSFAACGLASGLAFWIRPEGLSVALVAASVAGGWWLAELIALWRRPAPSAATTPTTSHTPHRLGCMLMVAAAATLVVLPYIALAGKLTSKKNPLPRPVAEIAQTPNVPQNGTPPLTGAQSPTLPADLNIPHTRGRNAAHADSPNPNPRVPQLVPHALGLYGAPVCTPHEANAAAAPFSTRVQSTAPAAHRSETLRSLGILTEPAAGERHADEIERPNGFWRTLAAGLYQFGREGCEGLMYFLLVPLAAGHFAPGRPRPRAAAFWFLVVLAAWHFVLLILLYFMAGYISHRHLMPLIAIGMPCTAAGTVWLAQRLAVWRGWLLGRPAPWGCEEAQAESLAVRGGRPLRIAATAPPHRWLLPALVCIMLLAMLPKCLEPGYPTHRAVVAAARWIARHARPGDAVLATSSYVRYYSRLHGMLLGVELPNLHTALGASPKPGGWDYVVLEIDRRHFHHTAQLLEHAGYQQVLRLAAHAKYPWLEVVVFQGNHREVCRQCTVAERVGPEHRSR